MKCNSRLWIILVVFFYFVLCDYLEEYICLSQLSYRVVNLGEVPWSLAAGWKSLQSPWQIVFVFVRSFVVCEKYFAVKKVWTRVNPDVLRTHSCVLSLGRLPVAVPPNGTARTYDPMHRRKAPITSNSALSFSQVCQFVVSVNGQSVLSLDYRTVSDLILTGPRTVVMEVMEEQSCWEPADGSLMSGSTFGSFKIKTFWQNLWTWCASCLLGPPYPPIIVFFLESFLFQETLAYEGVFRGK